MQDTTETNRASPCKHVLRKKTQRDGGKTTRTEKKVRHLLYDYEKRDLARNERIFAGLHSNVPANDNLD